MNKSENKYKNKSYETYNYQDYQEKDFKFNDKNSTNDNDTSQQNIKFKTYKETKLKSQTGFQYTVLQKNDPRFKSFMKFSDEERSKKGGENEKYDKNRKSQNQEEFFRQQDDKYSQNRKLDQDANCPESELYINWIGKNDGSDIDTIPQDMEVRNSDKAQFFTGNFVDHTKSIKECFFARIDRYGNPVASSYLKNINLMSEQSYCPALTITENNDIIAVGTATSGTGNRVSALIVMLDDDLTITPRIRIWSNSAATGTPSQEATDVDTTSDGGIFVTGFISNTFSLGGYDCFILRLNYTLDVIYAKSFGTSTDHEQCYSIQVTRNYDYIYLGGIKYLTTGATMREMIFYKFDSYADSGIAQSIAPTGSETLSLKRIMLTEKKTFSGTNDNNILYFCGYTDTNNGDLLIGTVTSTSLTSISVTVAFRYGSPDTEAVGDCTLTEDNAYILVLFNTMHKMDRKTYTTTTSTKPIDYNLVYPEIYVASGSGSNSPLLHNSPYDEDGTCYNSCNRRATNTLISNYHTAIQDYCEDNLFNEIATYMTDYHNDEIYSWTTCDFYVFDYNAVDCSLEDIKWKDCDARSGTLGTSYTYISTWWGAAYNDCKWALTSINTEKPWYSSNCRNDQFKKNVFERIFTTYTTSTQRQSFIPYFFCIDNDSTQTNNYCTYDDYNFIFEQDCTDDANRGTYYNWFIMKVQISTFTAANIDSFPLEAVYFGDRDGSTIGYSIDVDDHGFIYVSGVTNAVRLGVVSSEVTWIYVKTHWRLTFEARYKQTSTTYFGVSEYLGKRFVRPKKFTNNDNPYYPSTSTAFKFTYNYLTESTIKSYQTSDYTITSLQINEKIFTLSFAQPVTLILLHIHTAGFMTDQGLYMQQMGDSHSSMAQLDPIRVVKTSSHVQYAQLPNICLSYSTAGFVASSLYKMDFASKSYQMSSSVAGLSFTYTNNDVSSQSYLSGTVTSNEGIYYTWWQGSSYSYSQSTSYNCPNTYYGYYQDHQAFASYRRFVNSLIVKIIVDDETLPPPENKMNIPDVTPTLGQRYTISNIDSYFTTSCSYYKVKRNKLLTASTGTNFNTTMIPNWMMFYELNKTFVMYPEELGDIYIDVFCYNAIDQFCVNTFTVSPQDTTPVSTFGTGITPYTIQYDNYGGVGQYFSWAQTTTYFTDDDTSSDALDTTYKHTDHTVWLTYIPTYVNGFKQIKWIGMLFGQSFKTTLNNIGTKTFTYQYQDQYSENSIPTATYSIKINQIPSPLTVGLNYKFSNVDPTDGQPTTYFDSIFPWVKDDYSNMLNIFTGTWFTDPDSDTLTYSLTMSDNSDRPQWIGFDKGTGELRGYPMVSDASRYLNLKFTAYDTKDGSYSYYKTLLLNVVPKRKVLYKELKIGYDRQYAYNVSSLFYDLDGDPLTFSFADSADQTALQEIGLDFYPANKLIAGKPRQLGTFPLIKIQASDPHGELTYIYFTILVKDYDPFYRRSVKQYQDQIVTQGLYFYFTQNNLEFFDPGDNQPLVLFASTLDDEPLPSWLHFDPVSRGFYGTAPSVMTLKVQIRAMNQISHDSKADVFNLKVIPNYNPKTIVRHFSNDMTVIKNDWFNISLDIQLFKDKEVNRNATMKIKGAFGVQLPSWIKFNEDNRTIYGSAIEHGIFRIDVEYQDDLGLKTFFNVKLTVLNQVRVNPSKIKINYVLFISTALGFFIYMTYLLHFNFQVYVGHKKLDVKERGVKNARKRFENYQEIEVFYHMPQSNSYVDQARQKYIRTVDSQETEKDEDEDIRGLKTRLDDQIQKRLKVIR